MRHDLRMHPPCATKTSVGSRTFDQDSSQQHESEKKCGAEKHTVCCDAKDVDNWKPHSPRSILWSLVPNKATQSEELDMLLLQASPSRKEVRSRTWRGCSVQNRASVWRILLDYEPLKHSEKEWLLRCRRKEYWNLLAIMGGPLDKKESNPQGRSDFAVGMLRQIDMDLPRTHPGIPLFQLPSLRSAMRRVLYLFATMHPESGYVQGMNELVTPLMLVFISEYMASGTRSIEAVISLEKLDDNVSADALRVVEADAYWTFSGLLSSVIDSYIENQPGMRKRIQHLDDVIKRVDPPLAVHLAAEGCQTVQYSFRWMSVLLLREFRLPLIVRLWDALLAEEDGCGVFMVFVCAALLINWRDELLAMDFQGMITLLQNLPTGGWTAQDIDMLVSQARIWYIAYGQQNNDRDSKTWSSSTSL